MDEGRQPSLGTVLGALVAGVAVVGTQFLGWEWGSEQVVPTLVGVTAAVVAAGLVAKQVV
ncbi:multidrug transporter [Halovenus marina]|uniref:multidrug transporter n=1 Tax=Halovenus marina TaxID=3396621 RepID=UPI003F550C2F